MPRTYAVRSAADRLWAKVDKAGDCWLWTGKTTSNGYGRIYANGVTVRTHRLSYEMHVGPIPEGLVVMHSCDNRRCVNPAHLSIGTCADNSRDMTAKERQAKGAHHGRAKLDERSVIEVRRRAAAGESYAQIARGFCVAPQTIEKIVMRRTWKDAIAA